MILEFHTPLLKGVRLILPDAAMALGEPSTFRAEKLVRLSDKTILRFLGLCSDGNQSLSHA
jgi:hypothetical protein